MKKLIATCLCLIAVISANAQSIVTKPVQLVAKFHVLNALNPWKPYLQGSGEVVIRDRLGIEAGYGIPYLDRVASNSDSMIIRPYGKKIMAELTWKRLSLYIDHPKHSWRFYDFAGISYRHLSDGYNTRGEVEATYNSSAHADHYAVITKKDVIAVKWGFCVQHRSIGFDAQAECGLNNLNRHFAGYDQEAVHEPQWITVNEYKGTQFSLNVALKFFWRFANI